MTRLFYTFLLNLLRPLLRRKLTRRGAHEPGYLQAVQERFGRYASPAQRSHANTIWVHAVSLGETRAAAVLIEALRERFADMRLVLTHSTATGRTEGARVLHEGDCQAWLPWDVPTAVRAFLDHFEPRIGILMETEIWPNLTDICAQRGLPLVLANARLSEKSLRWAQRLSWLARPAYRSLAAVWAQTQQDAERLRALGANVQGVFGNVKFDATPQAEQLARGRRWRESIRRAVVMFASSREDEELALLQLLVSKHSGTGVNQVRDAMNSVVTEIQWLLVPRHPQRFDEVASLIEQCGFGLSRRSQWVDGPPSQPESGPTTIWLGDSLGEMAQYYALADLALLGGSFEPLGGQNLIEAAACACPVVMGPHTFNFSDAADLAQAAGAALRVADIAQAVSVAVDLAHDARALEAARQAADVFARTHQGATARLTAAIEALLTSAATR